MKSCGNCEEEIEDHLDLCDGCEECSQCRQPVMSDDNSNYEFWICDDCNRDTEFED